MKAINVHIGEVYEVRVSGQLAWVRITAASPYGGWVGVNEATRHEVRLRTAGRLRCNLTLRDFTRAFVAAKKAGTDPGPPFSRSVKSSDYDGTEFAMRKPVY